MTEAINIPEST